MQILAVLRRRTEAFSQEQFAALLDVEAEALRSLYASGVVRAAWSREDVLGACLMFEAETVEAAHEALASLPLFAAGMLEHQLIPLRGYRGFGPRG
jgi:muconolactone delta-isomerase